MKIVSVVGRIFLGLIAALAWVLGIATFGGVIVGVLWVLGTLTPWPSDWMAGTYEGTELAIARGVITFAGLIIAAGVLRTLYKWGERTSNVLAGRR